MSRLATISLNFSDGEQEIIGFEDNKEILSDCIRSAAEGKTIYSICGTCRGYEIQKREPGNKRHEYVSLYRNGEYKWVCDYLYAQHYSKERAIRHIRELYRRDCE